MIPLRLTVFIMRGHVSQKVCNHLPSKVIVLIARLSGYKSSTIYGIDDL